MSVSDRYHSPNHSNIKTHIYFYICIISEEDIQRYFLNCRNVKIRESGGKGRYIRTFRYMEGMGNEGKGRNEADQHSKAVRKIKKNVASKLRESILNLPAVTNVI